MKKIFIAIAICMLVCLGGAAPAFAHGGGHRSGDYSNYNGGSSYSQPRYSAPRNYCGQSNCRITSAHSHYSRSHSTKNVRTYRYHH